MNEMLSKLVEARRGVALFHGPTGTGKTLAAFTIARELGINVVRIDLASLVSKYIGETEKHIDAVFAEAEQSGALLLFDEADALFGKRSEVRDSHDKYANLDVSYLLQRIERFDGLLILTSNARKNIDEAFVRRLRFVVEFS
jgi:SpoVK/Ycf46/Vps4 family AAA+-type ATPase